MSNWPRDYLRVTSDNRLQLVIHDSPNNSNNSIQLEDIPENRALNTNTENVPEITSDHTTENIPENMAEAGHLISAARNYGEILPRFSGKDFSLESFIIKVDKYHTKYGNGNDESLNEYVYCMICSRLTDEANAFMSCRPDLKDWPSLKEALRNKYGDLTDRKILMHQFKSLKLRHHEHLNDFIERIKNMQTRLDVKIQMDQTILDPQKLVYKDIHEQTSLEVLYNNCPPMLQTILDVRDHDNLAAATNTVLTYISKHPFQEKQIPSVKPVPPKQSFPQRQPFTQQFRPNNNNFAFNRSYNNMRNPNVNNYRPQQPTNNPNPTPAYRQNTPQNNTTNNSRINSAPVNRPAQNSSQSFRTNRFQGSNFKNWRQPKPQINFAEVVQPTNENYDDPYDQNFPNTYSYEDDNNDFYNHDYTEEYDYQYSDIQVNPENNDSEITENTCEQDQSANNVIQNFR